VEATCFRQHGYVGIAAYSDIWVRNGVAMMAATTSDFDSQLEPLHNSEMRPVAEKWQQRRLMNRPRLRYGGGAAGTRASHWRSLKPNSTRSEERKRRPMSTRSQGEIIGRTQGLASCFDYPRRPNVLDGTVFQALQDCSGRLRSQTRRRARLFAKAPNETLSFALD